jgi:inner membrane protein
MDSITQITLGAAVGELVLGRKVGNRAMMWGAIGGTIPDLDVLANFFLDPVHALAFHRGITHSIFFSILAAFPFAWIVHRLYRSETHRKPGYKWFVFLLNLIILLLISGGLGLSLIHI